MRRITAPLTKIGAIAAVANVLASQYSALKDAGIRAWVVNARHVKAVPEPRWVSTNSKVDFRHVNADQEPRLFAGPGHPAVELLVHAGLIALNDLEP